MVFSVLAIIRYLLSVFFGSLNGDFLDFFAMGMKIASQTKIVYFFQ